MRTLGERIREMRGGMQLSELAGRLGIHKNTMMNYEKGGRAPDADLLLKFLEIFPQTSPAWLLTGEGPMKKSDPLPDGFIMLPRYELSAETGHGRYVESEQIVDFVSFKDDWVHNYLRVPTKDLALITVKGDSMAPTLNAGDLILVDLRVSRIEDSAVYVIEFDDALLVKRVQRKLDGSIVIKNDNPFYEPEILSNDQVAALRIVGRVIWTGKKM
ncbi:XRE family transcriptional regulator [Geothermobacter hydrogeniphilus]|nr:S24 family peptidase [Geothermobacter hydrogeniphilus]